MSRYEWEADYPLVWDRRGDREAVMAFAEEYKLFLDQCKTEREAADRAAAMARDAGFCNMDLFPPSGGTLKPGERLYTLRQNKVAALFVLGRKPLTEGMRIICAHLDSPRLDLRPDPLYEAGELALMKTHYYGGVKKYQWAALPLALHGVIVKKGGQRMTISIGEEETAPVVYISDLPKHLSAQQSRQTMAEGIGGEDLNILVGSIPLEGEEREPARRYILKLLYQKYGVTEKDLTSAELEIVPAGRARDGGLDRSMVVAYGQDDRVCAYTALQAILRTQVPEHTSLLLLVDKEEVGSQGATGMKSRLMENLTAQLLELAGTYSSQALRQTLERSYFISADVALAYDPSHPEVFEKKNAARLGRGPVLVKYAGHLGKKDCNDASAEFLALLREVLDTAGVCWQVGEFGKIDLGGGGTIAPFAAAYGMQVVDCGVLLLSMHAPYELSSKADIYETYRAYAAFYDTAAEIGDYM